MYNIYYIESAHLAAFLKHLQKNYKIFSPVIKDRNAEAPDYSFQQWDPAILPVFNAYRCIEPLKTFFTYPYEKVAGYFPSDKNITEVAQKSIILGVKSCDIAGHKIQDFVFLEGSEVDSLYSLRRENTVFISGDCTDFKEACHCLAWEIMPYPTAGFDINLSPLNDGYLAEVGSSRGEELIHQCEQYFSLAKDTQIFARKAKRESLIERLRRHLLPQNLVSKDRVQDLVRQGYAADTWQQFMLACVECGGCNLICDTCHCFLLSDESEGSKNLRARAWDSCQYANFSRVAGGANPLKLRAQRLRNRFMKKFDFFIDNLGMPACCGCGRCIEVCPGKIDIREVLKDLAKKVKLKL
jgi:sulfhydrogenase subunit beta (sulfur reductase)